MKIKIKYKKFKLTLFAPLGILKTRLITKKIEDEKLKKLLPKIVKELKKYAKSNGHFTLIELKSNNTILIIRV